MISKSHNGRCQDYQSSRCYTGTPSPVPNPVIEKELSPEYKLIDEEKAVPLSVVKDVSKDNDNSNIVGWDGPDDLDMALNWPARKKWTMTLLLGTLTLLTYASNGIRSLYDIELTRSVHSHHLCSRLASRRSQKEFHSMNADLGALTVSGYLLGYVFCLFGIALLSKLYERLLVYHISTLSFILFNLACLKSTDFPMLTVFRILSGIAGSFRFPESFYSSF
jgi:hypothetical protein